MTKLGNMATLSNKCNDFLIPLKSVGRIRVYTTCRAGFESVDDSYSGFSLCHYTGDRPEHFMSCRQSLADRMGIPEENLIIPRQTHGCLCRVIDRTPFPETELEGVDGLVTSLPDVVIGVNTADCLPVVMTDEDNGVVGVAHAGWRGALGGVVQSTLEAMLGSGADVGSVKVIMGPCICTECFEVGREVASQFPSANVVEYDKPHVDLAGYVRDRLMECGVRPENISLPGDCTRCRPELYFSARAMGVASGRNFTFAVMG